MKLEKNCVFIDSDQKINMKLHPQNSKDAYLFKIAGVKKAASSQRLTTPLFY